jgi:two-component system nitrate/nitrite response regulator NarL
MLRRDEHVEEVSCAATAQEAAARVADAPPDAVLVDSRMPGSVTAVRMIVQANPEVSVLALGVDEHVDAIVRHAEAGVAGYVGPEADATAVVDAVYCAVRGELPCAPGVAAALLRRVSELAGRVVDGDHAPLTSRQREVARLIVSGLSNKEIATALYIEVATVKGHVHAILEKLQLHRREEIGGALGDV